MNSELCQGRVRASRRINSTFLFKIIRKSSAQIYNCQWNSLTRLNGVFWWTTFRSFSGFQFQWMAQGYWNLHFVKCFGTDFEGYGNVPRCTVLWCVWQGWQYNFGTQKDSGIELTLSKSTPRSLGKCTEIRGWVWIPRNCPVGRSVHC